MVEIYDPSKGNQEPEQPEVNWTVDQWRMITSNWTITSKVLTQQLRQIPYESSVAKLDVLSQQLPSIKPRKDREWARWVTQLASLPDEALDRVIQSFSEPSQGKPPS